jgi:hypothetical protein
MFFSRPILLFLLINVYAIGVKRFIDDFSYASYTYGNDASGRMSLMYVVLDICEIFGLIEYYEFRRNVGRFFFRWRSGLALF